MELSTENDLMNQSDSLITGSSTRFLSSNWLTMPSAAVVRTIEAINDSKIIIAENNPNVLNNPIDEVAMIENPAISETAEPIRAKAQAPPTPCRAFT